VNTPCSHLDSFCTTGVSSGLATTVTLTQASHERLGVSATREWTCFPFNFCTVECDCCWVAFELAHPVQIWRLMCMNMCSWHK
jgi:hypothetical protein